MEPSVAISSSVSSKPKMSRSDLAYSPTVLAFCPVPTAMTAPFWMIHLRHTCATDTLCPAAIFCADGSEKGQSFMAL